MKRKLKFRAWDGESVRYDVTGFEHGVGNEMAGVFLDGDYFSMEENKPLARHAAVMQYTGLDDKNGVEIYEGDILSEKVDQYTRREYEGETLGDSRRFVVGHNIDGLGKTIGFYLKSLHPYPWNGPKFLHHIKDCEVIGNIYENPELIGGE